MRPLQNGKKVTKIIEDPDAIKFISAITLMEVALLLESKPKDIKINIPLATFFNQALQALNVQVLAIAPEHAQRFYEIQLVEDHKDQYDRMIIAQGASTGFTIISDDRKFPLYPIRLISND